MNLNEYQEKARSTAIYPSIDNNITYPTLGLCGEAGEVAEKVKKIERDQGGIWSNDNQKDIMKELGDVIWYVANVASEFGLELEDIAQGNIDKLSSRKERGVLKGSGDDR